MNLSCLPLHRRNIGQVAQVRCYRLTLHRDVCSLDDYKTFSLSLFSCPHIVQRHILILITGNVLLLFCFPKKVTKKGDQRCQLQNVFVAQANAARAKHFTVHTTVGSQPHPKCRNLFPIYRIVECRKFQSFFLTLTSRFMSMPFKNKLLRPAHKTTRFSIFLSPDFLFFEC